MSLKPLQVQYISGAHRKLRRLGIYIHIPFCVKKCNYCDFYSVASTDEQMDAYCKALVADLRRNRRELGDAFVETVFFGGGTPGLLGVKRLSHLLSKLESLYEVAADAEITLETNPAVLQEEDYRKLRRAGFNRLSIGVQSFNDEELVTLGRVHTAQQAANAVQAAQKAGFENINIDLMFGLPGQTEEKLRKTLETALLLNPQHISFYGLRIEEGTPFARIRDTLALPNDEAYARLYLCGVAALAERGYRQYEISNFAREGFACQHNLKYWRLNEYAGFGPAAHSYLSGHRFGIARDVEAYMQAMQTGAELVRTDEEEVDLNGQLREYVMMSLRLSSGINRMVYEARFGHSFSPAEKYFAKLARVGLAERTDTGWRLTPKGFLVSNSIIVQLLQFIDAEEKRMESEERDQRI